MSLDDLGEARDVPIGAGAARLGGALWRDSGCGIGTEAHTDSHGRIVIIFDTSGEP